MSYLFQNWELSKDSPGMDIKPSDLPHTTEEGASAPTPDDLPSYGEYHGELSSIKIITWKLILMKI